MAEIRIVRKDAGRRRALWLVPLILLLALVPWYLYRRASERVAARDTTTAVAAGAVDTTPAEPAGPAAPDAGATVTAFTSFVAAGQPEMADTAQIRYAADGLLRLADALEALIAPKATAAFTAAVATMRQHAGALPAATGIEPTHMEIARPAFSAATTALTELQRVLGAGDVSPAVRMAGTIASRGALRSQREKIQNFFDQTATALQTVMQTPGITPAPDSAARSARMDSLHRADSLRLVRVRQAGGRP